MGFEQDLQEYCGGSEFWNLSLTWNTGGRQPDFTDCFQWTVVRWAPVALLLLGLPFHIFQLVKASPPRPNPRTCLNSGRMALTVLHLLVVLMDVWKYVDDWKKDRDPADVYLASPLVQVFGFLVVLWVQEYERRKAQHTSWLLFLFWFLSLICGVVPLNSYIQHANDEGKIRSTYYFAVFVVYYFLVIVQLVLCCFVDLNPANRVFIDGKRPSPEGEASFLSFITYWWLTGLVWVGYRKPLEENDLWAPFAWDRSPNILPEFEAAWQKELSAARRKANLAANRQPAGERTPLLSVSADAPPAVQPDPSLTKVMAKVFGLQLLKAHAAKLVYDGLQFVSPLLLQLLIQFTADKAQPEWRGYLYAPLFFIVAIAQSIFFNLQFHVALRIGMHVKAAVIGSVYNKALTMSNEARKDSTVGEIVNLMSVDAQRLQDVTGYLWILWSGPLQIIIAVYMLNNVMGPSIWAGVAIIVLLIPINGGISVFQRRLQVRLMGLKDKRLKLMDEVLNGMKVLKLYAWELPFRDKIEDIRRQETDTLKKMSYFSAFTSFSFMCAPFLVMLATFATYILTSKDKVLDAERAFVSLSLFNILRFPINILPMLISFLVQASVSIKRLCRFLSHPDLDPDAVHEDHFSSFAVQVQNGSFSWASNAEPCLRNINMRIPPGSLVAVVGTVGSGKSSLLSALLGETIRVSGDVSVKGSVAYVAQQAWIQNETVRNNILFNKEFDERKYQRVIDACALKTDLEILDGGDQTEIGEKGINLSGGQKQRVSLARAVYSDSDLYYLDDPLSAVDAHVGKHIFREVVSNRGMLKGKTRVLVTHGIQWLPEVDLILVMSEGRISEAGTYEQLLSHEGAFAQFLKEYFTQLPEESENEAEDEQDEEVANARAAILTRLESVCQVGDETCDDGTQPFWSRKRAALQRGMSQRTTSGRDQDTASPLGSPAQEGRGSPRASSQGATNLSISPRAAASSPGSRHSSGLTRQTSQTGRQRKLTRQESEHQTLKQEEKKTKEKKLIQEEKSASGKVQWSVFFSYARAVGVFNTIAFVSLYILYQGASVFSNIWLSQWTDNSELRNTTISSSRKRELNDLYLGVYGGAGAAQALLVLFFSLVSSVTMVRAARKLHNRLLYRVLRAPMSFFDTTPIGRIVNRFSNDIATIDSILPMVIRSFLNTVFSVLSTIFVISYSTPLFLTIIVPVMILYYFIQSFYIPTTRQLKRLESTTRSPIYTHFSETITGAATIRAYRYNAKFMQESQRRVDRNLVAYWTGVASNRWLGVRLDFLGNLLVLAAALFAVIGRDNIGSGIVGLSVSYAMQVTSALNFMVRSTSDLETNIVAVERIKEYTETESEAEWSIARTRPDLSWPAAGGVKLDDYCLRYRPGLDLVLRGITCKIEGGQKVGIVGRTGAGKSSMTLALFRLIEPAAGVIRIDGVDISTLGLHELRQKLTILPQDPVLFSGTLRMNLDPVSRYTDAQLWEALELSHLKSFVRGLPAGLEHEVGEGGQSLSVGQRQLVCLARTLLRKTKILVLDEATAAVDYETDELIQQTIRSEFADCTILTIAHRINTIMDSDKVLVLDKGLVKEFDAPDRLLADKSGIFYGMAKDAGLV